jgi:TATA-box binding protein (TBP) (component of TFIID and TFIIIB)
MGNGDEKIVAAVVSFLDRQKLDYEKGEAQHCTQFHVRTGAQKATVSVYNSGKIVVGGADSRLKTLLLEMKQALEAGAVGPGQALPFEIEKFPQTIRERVPDCDPVIIVFVEEAIKCIKNEALLAAAFMIGAASERAVNLLIHTYADAIREEANRTKFISRISNRSISKKYEEFVSSFKSGKSRPTDPVLNDIDVVIGTTFQFCRITRNEVGHPQIVPDLERGVLIANLGNFVTYIERIYKLMKHFRDTGVVV